MDTDAGTPENHKKELIIGASVIGGIIALIVAIALIVYNGAPRIVYTPAEACDLLKPAKARELLGNKALKSAAQDAKLSGNMAISKCGYTDGNPDMDSAIVAAITVRSGVNDRGVEQNKTEFTAGKPNEGIEDVKDVGEKAYFNQKLGQLNILDGRNWIILSYGVGATPETNTVDKAVELAKVALHQFRKSE